MGFKDKVNALWTRVFPLSLDKVETKVLQEKSIAKAESLGHTLGKFYTFKYVKGMSQACCKRCSLVVMVDTRKHPSSRPMFLLDANNWYKCKGKK